MPYEKTVWVPGGPPGLSATNLNKMEQGIYDAVAVAESALDLVEGCGARISQGEHDQYNLHMELYYTGHHSGPSIAGMLGMTFDGFQDLLRVDAANSTCYINTTTKIVSAAQGPINAYRFISAESANIPGLSYTDPVTDPEYAVDVGVNNLNTPAKMELTNASSETSPLKLDLGEPKTLRGLWAHGHAIGSGSDAQLRRVAYSNDGSTWTVLTPPNLPLSGWKYHDLGGMYTARYWAVEVYAYNSNPGSGKYARVNDIVGAIDSAYGYPTVVLQSTAKTLESAPEQLTLYLSALTPPGTGVVPEASCDGGNHWEAFTLESSRVDPQFTEYTEGKYVLTPQHSGTSLIVRFTLNPSSDHASAPTIKRYGLFWS